MIIPTAVKWEETCAIKESPISVRNKFVKNGTIKEYKLETRMHRN